eukprot:6188057-Pleurochrysis_carterae.AAC.5
MLRAGRTFGLVSCIRAAGHIPRAAGHIPRAAGHIPRAAHAGLQGVPRANEKSLGTVVALFTRMARNVVDCLSNK